MRNIVRWTLLSLLRLPPVASAARVAATGPDKQAGATATPYVPWSFVEDFSREIPGWMSSPFPGSRIGPIDLHSFD